MDIVMRAYRKPADYEVVARFLVEVYESGDQLVNWLEPRWEYMHAHPYIENIEPSLIGIAELTDGTVIGLVHPEHAPAFCYLQVRPGYERVKTLLVDWAEERLGGWSRTLERDLLGIHVDDSDGDLQSILRDRGYECSGEWGEQHARLLLDAELAPGPLPEGFHLQSLADENDLAKVNRVLWRGFNHDGPPPESHIPSRRAAQQAPGYRKDLNMVVVAPDASYVSYAGIWYLPDNRVAYVEPVATDPDFRRMGLGKAAVLEAVRRTRELGAEVAWVGSDQEFYLDMGFEIVARSGLWHRDLNRKI
jgi:GNAT superfamily N-acetyltransferase